MHGMSPILQATEGSLPSNPSAHFQSLGALCRTPREKALLDGAVGQPGEVGFDHKPRPPAPEVSRTGAAAAVVPLAIGPEFAGK